MCVRFRVPVSSFDMDSIYEVSPPRVDLESRIVFEDHIQAGQGLIQALRKEDHLLYREYIKNRYM